jgi:uncharacterized membrane protein
VPAALSAAGLIIAFGVTYAAYALYNIFAPAVAFPLLAAISLCALWLATRQGQLIAALGLVGATFTPALVESNDPSTSGFFAYLLVIVVASLWLLRKLNWWWLGYAAVGSTAAWALLWINGVSLNPTLPIGIFALALGAAATLVPRGREILNADMGNLLDAKSVTPPLGVAIAGLVAGGCVLAALVVQSGHVLLVKRGAQPGKGLLALPGGFIQSDETLLNGMVRKLREETQIKVPAPVLAGSVKSQAVFDAPFRSGRGRTITHAFYIELRSEESLPKIKGGGETSHCFWLPLGQLDSTTMFEDHYFIIQKMLGLI